MSDSVYTEHTIRKNIYHGLLVVIVEKQDQGTGRSTRGIVKEILTSASVHPRGIKVRLESGEVGRVQYIEL
ncbi:YwbE family protein [Candidatus Uhrbacteria bacterium]|nr:YwbE family protein [Candidatus Uhrbacteria bacterium]